MPQMELKQCRKCGQKLDNESKYCKFCGEKVFEVDKSRLFDYVCNVYTPLTCEGILEYLEIWGTAPEKIQAIKMLLYGNDDQSKIEISKLYTEMVVKDRDLTTLLYGGTFIFPGALYHSPSEEDEFLFSESQSPCGNPVAAEQPIVRNNVGMENHVQRTEQGRLYRPIMAKADQEDVKKALNGNTVIAVLFWAVFIFVFFFAWGAYQDRQYYLSLKGLLAMLFLLIPKYFIYSKRKEIRDRLKSLSIKNF